MEHSASVADMLVVGSGVLIFRTDEEATLRVRSTTSGVQLEIRVAVDVSAVGPDVHFESVSSRVLRVLLRGMHGNPLGITTKKPYVVGVLDEKPLLLAFHVTPVGKNEAQEFRYTLYSGELGE